MKYLFFLTGFILFGVGLEMAYKGALNDWDANVAAAPCVVGALLMGAAVAIHAYDNWKAK